MVGRSLILDAADFIKGESSGSEIADGGFSDESVDLNLAVEPGVVYARGERTDGDGDTILDDEIIASCPDAAASSSFDRMVMTDDGDFMTYNGTKLADVTGGQDTTRTYTKGISDMVPWAGRIYFTSFEQLGEWQLPSTFNFTFSAFANSGVPHPLLVFENNLYIADGNLLKRMTSAGGSVSTILTLASGDFIQAMGIDQSSGKILLSIVNGQNASSTLPRPARVAWYDGKSNKLIKYIVVESMVTAFHSHQGVTYVGYGQNVGYLTGSGVQFLKKLTNVDLNNEELPYKHNFASVGKTMYVVNDTRVLAYGKIIANAPAVWWTFLDQPTTIQSIFDVGNNKLGYSLLASSTPSFFTIDTTDVSGASVMKLMTNWLTFARPVKIKSMELHFDATLATSDSLSLDAYEQSEVDFNADAALKPLGGTQTSIRELREIVGFTDNRIFALKIAIRMTSGTNMGIKRIIIFYDFYE